MRYEYTAKKQGMKKRWVELSDILHYLKEWWSGLMEDKLVN